MLYLILLVCILARFSVCALFGFVVCCDSLVLTLCWVLPLVCHGFCWIWRGLRVGWFVLVSVWWFALVLVVCLDLSCFLFDYVLAVYCGFKIVWF